MKAIYSSNKYKLVIIFLTLNVFLFQCYDNVYHVILNLNQNCIIDLTEDVILLPLCLSGRV